MISLQTINMSFLSQLLEHYHLNTKDLGARSAPGSFDNLKTPFELEDFKKVIERLKKAISTKEKTVIYGDYDVDGLTATSIMKLALDETGLNPGFFIPSRYVEGYGLNVERVRQFALKGYHLIITVDNGIAAVEAISEAKKLGMDVVVIDHHDVPATLPKFDFCFHQTYSHFLDYNCSAASLCFFVASFLLRRFDSYFATLAGIAVFSDVMPLVGNNLELAKMMKQFINKHHYRNLCYILGNGSISYDDINFTLIPSFNSVGRIMKDSASTNNACRLLLERSDEEKIKKYANLLISCNVERKEIVKNVTFLNQYTLSSDHGICLRTNDFSGLSGLFANKVMREKNVPVAIFSKDDINPEYLVGSLRAPEGYKVDEFLKKYQSMIVAGGGHERAAGLTIKEKDYYLVCTMFISECSKQALEMEEKTEDVINITIEDLNEANYSIYESFMPFGEGFPAPSFKLTIEKERLKPTASHKCLMANSDDQQGQVVIFDHIDEILNSEKPIFDIYGNLTMEIFRNSKKIKFLSTKIM